VRFGESSDRRKVVKSLEERIGVGVCDVSFETGVRSFVVESIEEDSSKFGK
jgi:hypothetical protein